MPKPGGLLRGRAQAFGGLELLRFGGQQVTFSAFEERTNRLANALAAHGGGEGDRAGVMLPNGITFPLAWFAVIKPGAAARTSAPPRWRRSCANTRA